MTPHRYCVRLALNLFTTLGSALSLAMPAQAQTCVDTQYGTVTEGSYTIQNDKWGEADDTGGYQEVCTGSSSNNSWTSTWNWTKGSGKIKAYPSMYRGWEYGAYSPDHGGFPAQVSAQKSLPYQRHLRYDRQQSVRQCLRSLLQPLNRSKRPICRVDGVAQLLGKPACRYQGRLGCRARWCEWNLGCLAGHQ